MSLSHAAENRSSNGGCYLKILVTATFEGNPKHPAQGWVQKCFNSQVPSPAVQLEMDAIHYGLHASASMVQSICFSYSSVLSGQ
mmetsp:Transcript_86476/g.171688  ORF Transcript_86476/g.171688 Transcript_86476/m.171688 type:complete len:84 (-) Transcript_86476:4312-4563(-)